MGRYFISQIYCHGKNVGVIVSLHNTGENNQKMIAYSFNTRDNLDAAHSSFFIPNRRVTMIKQKIFLNFEKCANIEKYNYTLILLLVVTGLSPIEETRKI
jgi:hypothetical protein